MKKLLQCIVFYVLSCTTIFSQQELEKDSIAYSIDIDDVVISSQYVPTSSKNSLYQVSTISRKELERKAVFSLDQALLQESRLRITYDPILGAKINLRGMSSENVAILQDGIPVIGRLDGAIDLSQINLNNVERIEIVEGPQSVIYGNNASGGIINIITKKSQIEPFNIQLAGTQEIPNSQNLNLQASFNHKKFYASVGASYLKDQPYSDDSLRIFEQLVFSDGNMLTRKKYPWNPKLSKGLNSSLRYFIDETNSMTLKWDYSNQTVRNLGELRRPVFQPYAFDENYLTDRNNYSLNYNGKIKGIQLETILARNEFFRILEQQRFEFDTEEINFEESSRDSSEFISHFFKLTAIHQFDKLLLAGGLQVNQDIGKGNRVLDTDAIDSTTVIANEYAIYGDLRYRIKSNLDISTSARLSYHSNYGVQVSPGIQSMFKINEFWKLRAGFARGFRSPTLKELYINFIDVNHFVVGNSELLPELTNDWNASFHYLKQLNKNKLNGSLKMYSTRIQNKIVLAEFDNLQFEYRNLDNFSVHGASLSTSFKHPSFEISNSLNQAFWYNLSSEESSLPSHSPVFDNSFSVRYLPSKYNFDIELIHRFVGKVPRYIIVDDQVIQNITESYQLLDLHLTYQLFNQSMTITGGVRNLLNAIYANSNRVEQGSNHASDTISASQLIGRGRTYYIGFKYRYSGNKSLVNN